MITAQISSIMSAVSSHGRTLVLLTYWRTCENEKDDLCVRTLLDSRTIPPHRQANPPASSPLSLNFSPGGQLWYLTHVHLIPSLLSCRPPQSIPPTHPLSYLRLSTESGEYCRVISVPEKDTKAMFCVSPSNICSTSNC